MTGANAAKYVAVREQLRARVDTLPAGSVLPAEPALCAEYGVSRITLRHAVDDLVFERYLSRRHGLGTFVLASQQRNRYRERFADVISGFYARQTAEGNTVTTRVLEQRLLPVEASLADEAAAAALRLSPGDAVLLLARLRFVNGTLHHVVETVIPAKRFARASGHDFGEGSLYGHLVDDYGVALGRNDLVVSVQPAPPHVAEVLGVVIGEKLLRVVSTMFDSDDTAVAHGVTHFTPANGAVSFGLRP
ncbi:GntR family transcriptional regulator [Subtercola sp. Z020]|uniref:GntR family transcriptional regulator n=1 Tax=Subtercola sp. Z020 TaxID=2080582 RepID=UPI000CE8DEF4|nr:GntR family transcriptional regulator [Subtercola sp. Z020]PPF90017.1 GntR family transcriptional regulator [Subtercola sp. Z020]